MSVHGNRRLLVLGCSQVKREALGNLPAIDRYDGSSYRVLRNYLRTSQWPSDLSVAILSAKYGLVGGFTDIEHYDQRMTTVRASELEPSCIHTLSNWADNHSSIHLSLGKDYLPALSSAVNNELHSKTKIFEGPIGMKLNQIKGLLNETTATPRHQANLPEAGSGHVTYFLPDWDDLLDENFDFETDTFSGASPKVRNDRHCSVLMQPKRMSDGILVSLAQHILSKGTLKRFSGTEEGSLAPKDLRKQFGLAENQSLFGDCGAFSYVNEDEPSISIEKAIALYDLHGFNFGASIDHIPVPIITKNGKKQTLSKAKRKDRVEITKSNAELFFTSAKKRNVGFIPVGTIQALTPSEYARNVKLYHDIGYRHLALGGLVPLPDNLIDEIVTNVMKVVEDLNPRPWIHLFGIFRPKLQQRFRELRIDSFDSATYFRKAWLRSDQNYIDTSGKWYAAIRVPMTNDGRTRKRLENAGAEIDKLQAQESAVMSLLCRYSRYEVAASEVLDAVIEYDERLSRSSDARSMRAKYERTLLDRPWEKCDCPFCRDAGIHVLIFRGSNRNKRRGAHNTLMLYGNIQEK